MVTDVLAYQIIIGGWGNTKSVIRREVAPGVDGDISVSTPDILSCDEARKFWVGWTSSQLSVGYSNVPFKAVFMSLEDDKLHPISGIGLSTGFGSIGDWMITVEDREYAYSDNYDNEMIIY